MFSGEMDKGRNPGVSSEDYNRRGGETVRRITWALARAFHLTSGRDLVPLLGEGEEGGNLDALESWVCRELLSPDDDQIALLLPGLVRRLSRTLFDRGEKR